MYPRSRSDPGQGSTPPRYPGSFLAAVRAALADMKWEARKWLGAAVECVDADGHEQVLGLENLFRRLRREDRACWPELVVEMLRSVPPESTETVALRDVADRILLRLGPPFAPMSEGKEIWYQPLVGKRLGVTLVIDYPNSMSYITQQQIADSHQDAGHWLQHAVANLRDKTPIDCITEIHQESGLHHCAVGDAYDSSRAMLLNWLLPGHIDNGFFVALPGRDHLLVLPVAHDSLSHVAWLRAVAAKTHQTVPYPISGEVFWVRDNAWHPFDVTLDKNQVVVTPPPEFTDILKRLAPEIMTDDPEASDDEGSDNLPN